MSEKAEQGSEPRTSAGKAVAEAALRGHVALVIVQLCFGLMPLFSKWAFESFSPACIAAWRILVGAGVLGLLAAAKYGKRFLPRLADLWRLQVCALLGVAINQMLYLKGLKDSTAVNAGLLMALIPVFTFLVAFLSRQERFSLRRAIGILIAFGGTALLFIQADPKLGGRDVSGNFLMATNALSYAIYLVVSKPLTQRYPPLVIIAWVFILSLWTVPIFTWGEGIVPKNVSPSALNGLILVLLFPTLIAYLLNLWALARLSATTAAVYIFLQPVIAVIAGIAVLGESAGGGTAIAGVGILLGLWVVIAGKGRSAEN